MRAVDSETTHVHASACGPWSDLLVQLRETSNARPSLIEALRTAHLELELQAEELRRAQDCAVVALGTSEAAFELLPLPLWLISEGGRTVRSNASAKATFGALSLGEAITGLLAALNDRTRLSEAHNSITQNNVATVRGVTTLPSTAGGKCLRGDLVVRSVPVDRNSPLALVAFIDLTRELEREAALDLALSRANDAVMAKSDFLSAVSHELRTPLNAIVGFSQLLRMKFESAHSIDASKAVKWVASLDAAAQHLTALVSDLLDQQALETGRMQIRCVDVPLKSLIEEAVEMSRCRFDQHGVLLQVELPPEEKLVHVDPARCKQVILNLLDNAAKYTPRGRFVHLSTEAEDHGARVLVRDEGPGLTPAQQANLFEPFNRLGADRSVIQGLGLGLAVSRQLVQRMGGQIGCTSGPGRGSCFWCWLPAMVGQSG